MLLLRRRLLLLLLVLQLLGLLTVCVFMRAVVGVVWCVGGNETSVTMIKKRQTKSSGEGGQTHIHILIFNQKKNKRTPPSATALAPPPPPPPPRPLRRCPRRGGHGS